MTAKLIRADPEEGVDGAPSPGGVLVITELAFARTGHVINAWWRFRRHSKLIASNAPGLRFAMMTVLWRRRTVIHVSCWDGMSDIRGLGQSRGHVHSVRWAGQREGVRTRSMVYSAQGTWRSLVTAQSNHASEVRSSKDR
jgi:hypothetical protein